MHGEFLTLPKAGNETARMSKSSGEFLKLDLLVEKGYDPLAYRYFCLNAHYRQQLAFTWESLDAAANAYRNLKRAVLDLRRDGAEPAAPDEALLAPFRQAVEDDLNMPRALAAFWAALKNADGAPPPAVHATLLEMDRVLGLGVAEMHEEALAVDEAEIDRLIAERAAAKKAKNFARADEIRNRLQADGIELMDTPQGTTWRRA